MITEKQTAFIRSLAARILAVEIDPAQPKLKFKPGRGNVDSKGRVHILNANIVAAHAHARCTLARMEAGEFNTARFASQAIDGLLTETRRAGA